MVLGHYVPFAQKLSMARSRRCLLLRLSVASMLGIIACRLGISSIRKRTKTIVLVAFAAMHRMKERVKEMIDNLKCIRCKVELDIFGFHKDAIAFEVELWMDGIEAEEGDVLCNGCANVLVECDNANCVSGTNG